MNRIMALMAVACATFYLTTATGEATSTQTRERGSTGGGSQTQSQPAFVPQCPQNTFDGTYPTANTECTECADDARRVNEQIHYVETLETALNEAIAVFNAGCPKPIEEDDPRDVTPPNENGPFYCGPDVSQLMLESLQRVQERMKMVPDKDKGLVDSANPIDSFLQRNGTNIDQKPDLESFTGSDQCPSGPCAPEGNEYGQICYRLWGYCVPQHVMNEVMFGFVSDQTYVPEVIQWAGGQAHEIAARGSMEMATAGAAYHVGDEISEEMSDDGSVSEDFLKERMEELMKTVNEDYPRIHECEPCPDASSPTEWDADFSTRDWFLHDGRKLLIEGYIAKNPPPSRDFAQEQQEYKDRVAERDRGRLTVRIGQLKAQLDRAKNQLRQMRERLVSCEQRHCGKPTEKFGAAVGQFFGELFEDVELEDPTPINDIMTNDQIIACPKCIRIAINLIAAQQDKAALETSTQETERERRVLKPDLDKAKALHERLRSQLGTESGVGGEAVDTTTGVRTTAYDNGEGQVEIKRYDRDGNQIGETEYRDRESTSGKRVRYEAAKATYENLQRQDDVLKAAIERLQARIAEKQTEISQLQAQLEECLTQCKTPPQEEENRTENRAGSDTTSSQPATSPSSTPNRTETTTARTAVDDDKEYEFNNLLEQVERSIGRDLTADEVRQYRESPEELYRFLGMDTESDDVSDIRVGGTSTGTPTVRPNNAVNDVYVGSKSQKVTREEVSVGDDFEIEIELDEVRSVDGTNAFDSRAVTELQHDRRGISVGHPTPQPQKPVVVSGGNTPPPTILLHTPSAPPVPTSPPVAETTPPTTVTGTGTPPVTHGTPVFELNGQLGFTHIVRQSPCPQPAGTAQVSGRFSQSGGSIPASEIEIISSSATGAIAPKLAILANGSTATVRFNCSSPANGTFSGELLLKVRHKPSGETYDVRKSITGTVTNE